MIHHHTILYIGGNNNHVVNLLYLSIIAVKIYNPIENLETNILMGGGSDTFLVCGRIVNYLSICGV